MRIYRLKIIEAKTGDRFDWQLADYKTIQVNELMDLPKEIAAAESEKPRQKGGYKKFVADIELLGEI